MLCVKQCPEGAIIGCEVKQPPVIDISRCSGCNACRSVCEFQAITVVVYITK
ncbi:MAG: 4Fe-4S binding protein [Proteobacteria bacterium]|nr:4Fe-4S binding protein [Pseudomonadota bacterium]